jgi:hypothetical protein
MSTVPESQEIDLAFQVLFTTLEMEMALRSGDWKLVSVTKGHGFPGDPEFCFWMVHRRFA